MGFEIALFVLLVIGALAFILSPVLGRPQHRGGGNREERARLRREKQAALLLLRDLEFDYRTGKLLDADYRTSRAEAERRALAILQRMDALERGENGTGKERSGPERREESPETGAGGMR